MTDLLDDLDAEELSVLVESIRHADEEFYYRDPWLGGMTDAEVVMELLGGRVAPWVLARHCPVRKVLLWVVRSNGSMLMNVPDGLRDAGLCRVAVDAYGMALRYVPEQLRDRETCLAALTGMGPRYHADVLRHVPEPIRASIRKELGI